MTTDVVVPSGDQGLENEWPISPKIEVPESNNGFGKIERNAKGALASGEAQRIARFLIEKDGKATASSFAMLAYDRDEHSDHQAASSTLGHLVKKGILMRRKAGKFVLSDQKPKRAYNKKPKAPVNLFTVGDLLEVVGWWEGKLVVRNVANPQTLHVVGHVT